MEGQNKGREMSDLPEEMIEEILSQLPVESLLRFRCVSKPWCSLIGSKRFKKKQLKASKRNTSFPHQRALLCCPLKGGLFGFSECSLSSLFHKPEIYALEFDFATTTNVIIDSLRLVGSCNGLVCVLLNDEEFVLWNPSTRISKKLPNPSNIDTTIRSYGFGCDEWSGDYKVVVIFESQYYLAHVYSLKSDSWKEISSPWIIPYPRIWKKISSICEFYPFIDERGKLKNGKLCWKIDLEGKGEQASLEFDLKRDVFEMVEKDGFGCWSCRSWRTLEVYLEDESSHVRETFPSLARKCIHHPQGGFMNMQQLQINNAYFDFDFYLESLETLDI